MRKEQFDKAAWSWADMVDPSCMTDEHVETAYRVKFKFCKFQSCKRNCRGNPHCLSAIGEKSWLGDVPDESWHNVEDPNLERRQEGGFVGLKNLGATCYINSLLQLWFHNLAFRKAIYSWNPEEDPHESVNPTLQEVHYIPGSSIAHLQLLFALLQFGNRRYIDPSPYIESLGIDAMIQQDAQEFSKLFISMLETRMAHQSLPLVRNMVQEQFRGQYSYVTKCSQCATESMCDSTFYELDLNIKGNKTLEGCLQEFLQDEKLEGADQYHCTICEKKQNATRNIRLNHLPPVLNLQLLRFVFDRQTGRKKKLNTSISFPEVLDMSKYLNLPEDTQVYNLSAVLIHRGPTANSGHYVAHICDSTSGVWYKFNDECVEKMDGKKLNLGVEEELEGESTSAKKSKQPRIPKGHLSSNNAYMLVYTLKSSNENVKESGESSEDEKWDISDRIQDLVQKENSNFEQWVNDVNANRDKIVEVGKARQAEIKRLYEMLPVDDDDDNFEFISLSWLNKWLGSDDDDPPVQNSSLLCKHEKMNPECVTKAKCISTKAADVLYEKYGGGPRLTRNEMCRECVANKCRFRQLEIKTSEESKQISNLLKAKLVENQPLYWVGKQSLKCWRRLVLESYDEDLSCSSTTKEKREDESASDSENEARSPVVMNGTDDHVQVHEITSTPMEVDNREDVENEACGVNSVEVNVADLGRKLRSKLLGNSEDVTSATENCEQVYNGANNKKDTESVESTKSAEDEEEDEEHQGFNEDILCNHGNLCAESGSRKLIQEEVWRILQKYFPNAPVFPQDSLVCLQCQNLADEGKIAKDMYRQIAQKQREALPDLYLDKNRPSWNKKDLNHVHVISSSFVNDWRKFLRNPGRREPVYDLNNNDLLCPHGGLLYEPEVETAKGSSESRLAMVSDAEWAVICDHFSIDKEITIARRHADAGLVSKPQVCQECMVAREQTEYQELLKYSNAKIFVRRVTDKDKGPLDNPTQREKKEDPEFEGSAAKKQKLIDTEVRRSNRHRRTRNEKELTVSSDQKLKDLKVMIWKLFNVAPYDQHLSLNGTDLIDGGETLASLDITPSSLILLRADEPGEDSMNAMEDFSTNDAPEKGFKGTELLKS